MIFAIKRFEFFKGVFPLFPPRHGEERRRKAKKEGERRKGETPGIPRGKRKVGSMLNEFLNAQRGSRRRGSAPAARAPDGHSPESP